MLSNKGKQHTPMGSEWVLPAGMYPYPHHRDVVHQYNNALMLQTKQRRY